ncbi:MAG TPA: cytochrome c [Terriglobia bacterium]|nr:cytochrome c [Terriglobia bacterium]
MLSRIILSCCALIMLGAWAIAQKSDIVTVPAPRTSATSGKEMYLAYCATCHGREGKGDGPAAGALKTAPTDLTLLSERNHGRFPSVQVVNVITGSVGGPAHGSKEMPIWGPIFLAMGHQHESEARLRVANLTDYVKSLQEK